MAGNMIPGPITFARISTDDQCGVIRTYVGEGQVTDDLLDTFGQWAVVKVSKLQKLMNYICTNGFEHHVAITMGEVADVLEEALGNYFGWQIYRHSG
jgi:L-fucose isomerase-like protein